jgi:TatD DNase family protein
MKPEYHDFHTHSETAGDGVIRLVCVEPGRRAASPFACGIHPWRSAEPDVDAELRLLERQAGAGELAAVGEIGLDRLRGAPLERQAEIFRAQLQLAARHDLPVVIHNVRCTPEILAMLEAPERSLWHRAPSGKGNLERIVATGAVVSFTADGLRHVDPAAVPLEQLGLETDDGGGDIRDAFRRAAGMWQVTEAELCARLEANFRRLFYRSNK